MHGCCQLVLSSHSVTARSPASLDLGPDDQRDERQHQDGLRRQLTTTTPLSWHSQSEPGPGTSTFQCEDFEVVTVRLSPVGTRAGTEIFLASMLSSGAELPDSTLRKNVFSIAEPLPDKDDYKTAPPSDSTVIFSHLDPSSQDFYFPRILSVSSHRSGVDIEFNLTAGARTGDTFCQDQYSTRISSNEKLANLKEKPKLICRSTCRLG